MKFDITKITDAHRLLISYCIVVVIFQIAFFAENFLVTVTTVSALFWLFVLPGLSISYIWKMDFLERLVISVAISASLVGISSYYLGIMGLHITISSIVLPIIYILVGMFLMYKERIIPKKS